LTFRIGFHVSIAGGIQNTVSNALKLGCTAFQMFTRNPRGFLEREITEDEVCLFKSALDKSGIQKDSVAVHMPYMPNLSGPNSEVYEKSVNSFTNELIKCSRLGIKYLIVNLGSDRGHGKANGIKQLVKSCEKAVDNFKSSHSKNLNVTTLLQNSGGVGAVQYNIIGRNLEELREILDKLPNKGYGICLDTCHAFASGYDLWTRDAYIKFIEKFDKKVGLENIKFIHLNDSMSEIGSNLDRHYHIGLGKIGVEGLKTIINDNSLRDLPMVMEMPIDSIRDDSKNLEAVLKLRT